VCVGVCVGSGGVSKTRDDGWRNTPTLYCVVVWFREKEREGISLGVCLVWCGSSSDDWSRACTLSPPFPPPSSQSNLRDCVGGGWGVWGCVCVCGLEKVVLWWWECDTNRVLSPHSSKTPPRVCVSKVYLLLLWFCRFRIENLLPTSTEKAKYLANLLAPSQEERIQDLPP
jgi:hypothetical protein